MEAKFGTRGIRSITKLDYDNFALNLVSNSIIIMKSRIWVSYKFHRSDYNETSQPLPPRVTCVSR